MNPNYSTEVLKLKEEIPFIKKIAIINDKKTILYSSEGWNVRKDLKKIISYWASRNSETIIISEVNYTVKTWTPYRLIASAGKKGHIIGVKNNGWVIIAQIESDGIIPIATMELSRFLSSIELNISYKNKRGKSSRETALKEKNARDKGYKREMNGETLDEDTSTVPFTARLMAHYRAQESNKQSPLLEDPFAARLAGNLTSYFKDHVRYSEMDYPIIRSIYVEQKLLTQWCNNHKKTQIVMLGAGLSTRGYRFKPLKQHDHIIFEIDLPTIIQYKEEKLAREIPLTNLERIAADLSQSNWVKPLKKGGFTTEIPTFWTLEGLLYYLEKEKAIKLIHQLRDLSSKGSCLFLDLMQRSRWLKSDEDIYVNSTTSFTKHFKWGIDIKEIPKFFSDLGWDVSCSFADEYDHGRDVGQKAMIFVQGSLKDQDL